MDTDTHYRNDLAIWLSLIVLDGLVVVGLRYPFVPSSKQQSVNASQLQQRNPMIEGDEDLQGSEAGAMNICPLSGIIVRALAVWCALIAAEILHGIARSILLVPHVGEFKSNQMGVFTGSIIILAIALITVRWIGATRAADLLAVGVLWLVLTLIFEIVFGRFVVGASWERISADYNLRKGGLLPIGMLVLLLSPLIAGKLRRTVQ